MDNFTRVFTTPLSNGLGEIAELVMGRGVGETIDKTPTELA